MDILCQAYFLCWSFSPFLGLNLWCCGHKGKVGFSPEIDETGAFSKEDDCCVLVIGSRQEKLVVDG